MKITAEEYRELVTPRKRSKYRNKRVKHSSGRTFDSIAEMEHYDKLLFLEREGSISDLKCQPIYELQAKPLIRYRADFSFMENGKEVAVDVKGQVTEGFSIKRRLFEAKFPDIELRIVRKGKK